MFNLKFINDLFIMGLFAIGSLFIVLAFCEFILKPLWHLIIQQ